MCIYTCSTIAIYLSVQTIFGVNEAKICMHKMLLVRVKNISFHKDRKTSSLRFNVHRKNTKKKFKP